MTDLFDRITAIVGPQGLIAGAEVQARAADFMGTAQCQAKAIVRPASTKELSEVMKLCHAAGQSVVPAGGNTGLVQGNVCTADDLQISLERMRGLGEIDPVGRTMVVEAGCVVQTAQDAAQGHGLIFPVDWGARGSATIGGGISTNAGGNSVVRFGMMRDNVLGLEAVLADGTIISSMNALLKNNAAYDLKQLFIGSEGTLGIVTRAVLKLQAAPLSTQTAMLACADFAAVQRLFVELGRQFGPGLTAFEVMWASAYEPIVALGGHVPPLPIGHACYVITEMSGTDPETDPARFEGILAGQIEAGIARDAVIAASQAQAEQIWAIRDDIHTMMEFAKPCVLFDISLPIRTMDRYLTELEQAAAAELGETMKLIVLGHIGDGNLHILLGAQPLTPETRHQIEALVYAPLKALGGSISAEHGIGLEKRGWLHLSRSDEEIALMRTLKAALDPKGILNPGKVI